MKHEFDNYTAEGQPILADGSVGLLFLLTTHLSGHHPGVIRLQERTGQTGNTYREIRDHASILGVRLYHPHPSETSLAYPLAEAIYKDQTYIRHSSTCQTARFTFSTACTIDIHQKIGPGRDGHTTTSYRKRHIGTVKIPGGLSREDICRQIATVIEQGWEPPPEGAAMAPDQVVEADGIPPYADDGEPFDQMIEVIHNGTKQVGPMIFLARQQGKTLKFAILQRGKTPQGPLFTFYRLYGLLFTKQAAVLLDEGIHSLDEPIMLPQQAASPVEYHLNWKVRHLMRVQGGRFGTWEDRSALKDLLQQLRNIEAHSSLYCTACGDGFLWDKEKQDVEQLASAEWTEHTRSLTLCPHTFYCLQCHRWSSPTTRSAEYSWSYCCEHDQHGPERRLTAHSVQKLPSKWRGSPIRRPSDVFIPPVREEIQEQRVALVSSRPVTYDVIIHFTEACAITRPSGNGSKQIPEGTTLIGTFVDDQPCEDGSCCVRLQGNTWILKYEHVSLASPITKHIPPGEQRRIAERSAALAHDYKQQGEQDLALLWYARAMIEHEMSGLSEQAFVALRFSHATLLAHTDLFQQGFVEMERVAEYYETWSRKGTERNRRDSAEKAVDTWLQVGRIAAERQETRSWAQKAAERILALQQSLPSRDAVRILFLVIDLLDACEDTLTASRLFDQAHAMYLSHRIPLRTPQYDDSLEEHFQRLMERWYGIHDQHPRALAKEPAIVNEREPVLLYDLAMIIGIAFHKQVALNKDFRLPKLFRKEVRKMLSGYQRLIEGEDSYPNQIFWMAESLGLLTLSSSEDEKPLYVPDPFIAQWGLLSPAEQCQKFLHRWTQTGAWRDERGHALSPPSSWEEIWVARKRLLAMLQQFQPGIWYRFQSLLYLLWQDQGGSHTYAQWKEQGEGKFYAELLLATLSEVGLITLGQQTTQDSAPDVFRLTDFGRFLHHSPPLTSSTAATMTPIPHVSSGQHLVVQPNFELFVLQPDFACIYRLLPFARPLHIGRVSRFELTEASLRRGRSAGLSIDEIIAILIERSEKTFPQNVEYTLRYDWAKGYKEGSVQEVILLEVIDEATAETVKQSHSFQELELRQIAPCAFVTTKKQVSKELLQKAMKKEGIVLRKSEGY